MAMPAMSDKRWTADEARALNEANPLPWPYYEVIDGALLVSPVPRALHQEAVLLLARKLSDYLDRIRVGHCMIGPADVTLEPDSTVAPDVFVTALVDGRKPKSWKDVTAVRVVAEVASPSTARYDRVVKRNYYLRNGVEEYWIVDIDARVIERWRSPDRPEIVSETLVWALDAEPFTLDVPAFFREICDEP
jgi:Uma2 family endonuclease